MNFKTALIVVASLLAPVVPAAVKKIRKKLDEDRKQALKNPANFTVEDLATLLAAKQREAQVRKAEAVRAETAALAARTFVEMPVAPSKS